ncbi:hypothetical protein DPMN_109362 [Dreissena polymorpha]|uniref:Uncharacterized protein n=1 Tax=Dreissena polymorpha TaxID=45954 RepID=A0A9D4QLX2_DREPO|nr:hypothetical protein DPMN_109362 [Dreissena polymorpha]
MDDTVNRFPADILITDELSTQSELKNSEVAGKWERGSEGSILEDVIFSQSEIKADTESLDVKSATLHSATKSEVGRAVDIGFLIT